MSIGTHSYRFYISTSWAFLAVTIKPMTSIKFQKKIIFNFYWSVYTQTNIPNHCSSAPAGFCRSDDNYCRFTAFFTAFTALLIN